METICDMIINSENFSVNQCQGSNTDVTDVTVLGLEQRDTFTNSLCDLKNGEKRRWICDKCPKSFSNKRTLDLHNRTHKTKLLNSFRCLVCGQQFRLKSARNSHCRKFHCVKHEDILAKSNIKSYTFNNDMSAKYKSDIYIPNGDGIDNQKNHCDIEDQRDSNLICSYPFCGLIFQNEDALSLHILEMHITEVHSCRKCQKRFHHEDLCKTHEDDCLRGAAPSKDSELEECSVISGEVFEALVTHSCPVCGKNMKSEKSLDRHLLLHNTYPCEFCGKMLLGKNALQRHRLVHETIKPYRCEKHCDKTFSTKAQYDRHLLGLTGVREHVCTICYQPCMTAADLKSHMVRHSDVKAFQCSDCGTTFARKNQLKRHELTHTGERLYKCDVCDKTFPVKSSLTKHSIVHLKPEERTKYACSFCHKLFSRIGHVNRHIRSAHLGTNMNEKTFFNVYINNTTNTINNLV